jgi:hypothetical protein
MPLPFFALPPEWERLFLKTTKKFSNTNKLTAFYNGVKEENIKSLFLCLIECIIQLVVVLFSRCPDLIFN